ncbi:MAG: hypothetical protein OXT65_07205 [Alphaproteobacteria bacterium]|nr:hypothetical protein [Alphaproteobacteria bacterium]
MLALIWIYRVVLAYFLYFVTAPFFMIVSLFMLRRGIYTQRQGLRSTAFFIMFLCAIKAFTADIWFARKYLLCNFALGKKLMLPFLSCTQFGAMALSLIGFALTIVSCFIILQFYRMHIRPRKIEPLMPEQVNLRFWANLTMWSVLLMISWLAAPWVASLTVGNVPAFLGLVSWQTFALVNFTLLLFCFWKSECCNWNYDFRKKDKMKYMANTWTAKDTMWLTVFFYVIALALSYVSHDILKEAG